MSLSIERVLEKFETGELSRRQFVAYLSSMAVIFAGVGKGVASLEQSQTNSLFQVSELNHIAIRVQDLDRSQKFYQDVLGLSLILKRSTFRMMGCGSHFVALFKRSEPGLDHLAFTLPSYDQSKVVQKLKANGIEPILEEERTYFRDPDGYLIQIELPGAWPGGGTRPESS